MYDVHIEVESLVYIYVYVGSRTIFFPVLLRVFFFRPRYLYKLTLLIKTLFFSKDFFICLF